MTTRRVFGSATAAAVLYAVGGSRISVAGAAEEWCEVDPEVVVVTLAGTPVVVHVTNYAKGVLYRPLVEQADIKYSVGSVDSTAAGDATLVTFDVVVPKAKDARGNDVEYLWRSVISSEEFGRGIRYAEGYSTAGNVIKLEFRLDTRRVAGATTDGKGQRRGDEKRDEKKAR